jgi:S1-C subfamily serine protease
MKRKVASAIILLFVFFSGVVAAGSANGKFEGYDIIKIFSANKEIQPEAVPAINFQGNTLVPIGVLRQLGVDVKWNASRQRVDVSMPVRTVPVLTAEQLDSLSKYVYKVTTGPTKEHPNGRMGSAFLVDGYMVTNAHVGSDAPFAQVQIDGNVQKVSHYDFVNEKTDVMGFKVTGGKSLPYSTEIPQVGDPVYDLSFPNGELKVTEGKMHAVTQGPNDTMQISHDAETEPGSSGGILLNGKGEIIGINQLVMTLNNGDYASFAIQIRYVLAEINK